MDSDAAVVQLNGFVNDVDDVEVESTPSSSSNHDDSPRPPHRGATLDEISAVAGSYSDLHQILLHHMIEYGEVTVKNFYMTFIRAYIRRVEMFEGADYSISGQVSAEKLSRLTDDIISAMNAKIGKISLRLRRDVGTANEDEGKEVVVLITEHHHTPELAALSVFKPDEQVLVNEWLDRMFAKAFGSSGLIGIGDALSLAQNLPNPLYASRAQQMLDILEQQRFFVFDRTREKYRLTARGLAELEPVLLRRYLLQKCALCLRPMVAPEAIKVCDIVSYDEGCGAETHRKCILRYIESMKDDIIFCPFQKCNVANEKTYLMVLVQSHPEEQLLESPPSPSHSVEANNRAAEVECAMVEEHEES